MLDACLTPAFQDVWAAILGPQMARYVSVLRRVDPEDGPRGLQIGLDFFLRCSAWYDPRGTAEEVECARLKALRSAACDLRSRLQAIVVDADEMEELPSDPADESGGACDDVETILGPLLAQECIVTQAPLSAWREVVIGLRLRNEIALSHTMFAADGRNVIMVVVRSLADEMKSALRERVLSLPTLGTRECFGGASLAT